jgi:hypothetical protein
MRRFLLAVVFAVALLCLLAAPALAAKTIVVTPSTTGDDTAGLQAAFNQAVRAGPGSTVRLTAGHFYTNNVLVRNFRGCFKGAGEGVTIIDTLRGNPAYAEGPGVALTPDPCHPTTYLEPFAFLIGFLGGNVSVSAMSFDITAPDPAEPFYVNPDDPGGRTSLGSVILVTGNASSAFDRVGFAAGEGDLGNLDGLDGLDGLNVGGFVDILGKARADEYGSYVSLEPTGGVHRVTRSSFSGLAGVETMGLTGGSLTVGGCAAMQNAFHQYWECCVLVDVSNSYVEISHNRMTAKGPAGTGVFALQGWMAGWGGGAPLPPLPAPRYVITDNDMRISSGGSGVFLGDLSYDFGAAGRLKAVLAGNTIVLDGASIGIGEYCTKDIKVLHNRFSGSAAAGIYVGDDFGGPDGTTLWPVSGWMIIGNDLRRLTVTEEDSAPIVLGEGSTHCVVVCPWTTDVIDKGVDNILVNAHRL